MSKLLDYYGRLSMRVMMHHSDITVTSNCTLGKFKYVYERCDVRCHYYRSMYRHQPVAVTGTALSRCLAPLVVAPLGHVSSLVAATVIVVVIVVWRTL